MLHMGTISAKLVKATVFAYFCLECITMTGEQNVNRQLNRDSITATPNNITSRLWFN
jgi:hypothetical protein